MSLKMMDLRKMILNVTVKRTKRKKKMKRVTTTTRVTWMIMKMRCPRAVRLKRKRIRRRMKRKTVMGKVTKSTRGRKRRIEMSSRSV